MSESNGDRTAELLQIETASWDAIVAGDGGSFFDAHLTDDALVVIPGMVVDRPNIVAAFSGEPEWASYSLDDAKVVDLGPDAAVLIYRATATRVSGGEPETFLIGTSYRRVSGEWRIASEHHVPGKSAT